MWPIQHCPGDVPCCCVLSCSPYPIKPYVMRISLRSYAFRLPLLILFCLNLPRFVWVEARTIDLNGNGMSDIWELIYGASILTI